MRGGQLSTHRQSKQATVMTWKHLSIALIFSLLTASAQARGGSPETRKKVASMSQKQRDTIVGITLGVSIPLLLALVVSIYKLRQRRQRRRQALYDSENEGTVHDARTSMARSSIESKATLVEPEPLPVLPEMAAMSQQQAAYLYYYSYYYPTAAAAQALAQALASSDPAAPPPPGGAAAQADQQQHAQAVSAPAQTQAT